ncbi:alpha-D-ribose 1-methylphosphonate 5-triphosphate diphosphatase [Rhodobacteraceae bacterium M382]|nr:alpha-D-ribose 1-methylphosphonate 5-triphosphate diphosphatase [Rhodobacteraceae bacterium M382]
MTGLALDLIGAQVMRPQEGLHRGTVSIADGVIVDAPVGRSVDLTGYLVMPGIIDLHGDGFERHVAPRRGAMKVMEEGLIAAESELAANGITTAVLAQFHSWEGGVRGPEFAEQVMTAMAKVRPQVVTDLIPQLRFETHMLDSYAGLPDLLAKWQVTYIVFNDHLPHDRLAAGKKPPRLTGQALKARRNPEVHFELLKSLHAQSGQVPSALDTLCATLARDGVTMGSHDDQRAEDRARWRKRGVRISEFPETLEAAEAARGAGDHVIMGAPNVVRGGSHNGNASAIDLIAMGLCDGLASDYHYPSPRRAAIMLAQSGVLDLSAAWALVSEGPARVLGLEDRGKLAAGLRADLVVLDPNNHRVVATMAEGRFSYLSGDIVGRFVA